MILVWDLSIAAKASNEYYSFQSYKWTMVRFDSSTQCIYTTGFSKCSRVCLWKE